MLFQQTLHYSIQSCVYEPVLHIFYAISVGKKSETVFNKEQGQKNNNYKASAQLA